ncbi:MAG: nuclear transport factor 2 family protein [Chloroflexi bacterium]|nr:nuclear transport factor 2 family protein [Chloroflexota bacterium]
MPAFPAEDIEAIKQLKARYFRFLDTKRWKQFGEVFAENGVSRHPETGEITVQGRAAIVERVKGVVRDAVTVHHGHMPEIELTSPTTAKGVWSMFDFVDYGPNGWKGYGHYQEEYVKVKGRWYIKSFMLTRLRLDKWDRSSMGKTP